MPSSPATARGFFPPQCVHRAGIRCRAAGPRRPECVAGHVGRSSETPQPHGVPCCEPTQGRQIAGLRTCERPTAWLTMQSAANSSPHQFPANREINREFRKFRASAAISTSNQRANSKSCSQIPYAAEQGIFAAITGNFFGITGNLIEPAAKALSCCRNVELARPLMSTPGTSAA